MSPEETERLRINLLIQFKNVDPMPLGIRDLIFGAKNAGFFAHQAPAETTAQLSAELDHLADPDLKFIAVAGDELRTVRKWKIAKGGRDYLERQGF